MKLDKAIELKQDAVMRLHHFYRVARNFGYTHNWILEQYKSISKELQAKKVPQWVLTSLFDTNQALLYETQQRDLIFGHVVAGEIYTGCRTTKNYRHLSELPDIKVIAGSECHHYWEHIPNKLFA